MDRPTHPLLARWAAAGRHVDVHGHRVFVRSAGDPSHPALVVLHGFPTCAIDFRAALPFLAERYHVVVHDHLGFGLSDKPADYSYSLLEQAEVAVGLWRTLGLTRVHVVAHDMGTSIATELIARRARTGLGLDLDSVTFCNGSMRLDLAALTWPQKVLKHPTWGPLLARASSEAFFKRRLRKTFADPAALDEEELSAVWAAVSSGAGRERLPVISTYLDERVRFLARWWGALGALELPCHVLWGDQDPVAVPAIARAVHGQLQQGTLTWMEGVGHYPMVEAPERWARAVLGFLDGLGSR